MSNTPSNTEAWDLWLESITGGHHPASLAKFALAVLAKWGTPQTADCTRSHPHEDMSGYCLLRTEIARLANENARLKASQPVVREPLTCEWTHNDDDGYWDTSCGKAWRFDDGGPKENNMNFCHCCGKTLRIKGGQHGTDT